MKQLLKSPNKFDEDSRFGLSLFTEGCRNSRIQPASHQDSETHAEQYCNLEQHEASKIEARVRCQICSRHQRPGETCCTRGRMLQGITEKVKNQAEQRISSQFITYVPGILTILALKKNPKSRRCVDGLHNHKNSEEQEITWDSTQRHNCGTIVERYL